ncbi:MAG TPA: glycosyltransferase family A protein, partial [Streptosporangiaceae bacterium]
MLKRQPSSRAPSLAIVIPTVKSEKFLSRVLDGLRLQTDRDFCLVIVQDGPSEFDLSLKSPFLAGAAAEVVVARHRRNYGGASALNTGSLLAGTDKILMLDDDMVLPPGSVGEFRRLLALSSDVCAIGFRGTSEPGTDCHHPQAALDGSASAAGRRGAGRV